MAADSFVELRSGRRRLNIEFSAECFHTGVELPERQMMLILATITTHK